jgi:cell division protein FtsI (penicillin-binding protein 3)
VFVEYPPQPIRQVISARAARLTTQALKTVVAPGGTAVHASLDHYTVAGKTGTAQKPDLVHGGYLDKDSIHSFIGYFPADSPEVCISVVIDTPKNKRFASATAVPAFQRIAELVARSLKIRPDRDVTQTHPAMDPSAGGQLAALPVTQP